MYDSFWMGVSFAFMVRLASFRVLRWPMTSVLMTSCSTPSASSRS